MGLLTDAPLAYMMTPQTAKIGVDLCPFPSNLPLELKSTESDTRKDNKHLIQSQVLLKKILGGLLFIANERDNVFLASIISAERAHEVKCLPEGSDVRADVALSYCIAATADGISKIEKKRRDLEVKRLSLRDPVIRSDPSERKRKRDLVDPLEEANKVNKERKIISESRRAVKKNRRFSFPRQERGFRNGTSYDFRSQQLSGSLDSYRPRYENRQDNGQFKRRDDRDEPGPQRNPAVTNRGGRQPRR